MNWKLIFQLSLLGLAMAIATVYVIPPRLEPFFWPVIFVVSAFFLARRAPGRYFLHGFLVGLANWVWVAAAHVVLHRAYLATHAMEIATMQAMPMPSLPPFLMPIVRLARSRDLPIPGLSGVVIGLFAWLASKFLRPTRASAPAR